MVNGLANSVHYLSNQFGSPIYMAELEDRTHVYFVIAVLN